MLQQGQGCSNLIDLYFYDTGKKKKTQTFPTSVFDSCSYIYLHTGMAKITGTVCQYEPMHFSTKDDVKMVLFLYANNHYFRPKLKH